MKDLTVYICTYHEEHSIKLCVEMVKANGPFPVVVVDASENELTADVAEKSGCTVLRCKKGLSSQRQMAIDHCSTKYLMFVDADDRLGKTCIPMLLEQMITNQLTGIQALCYVYKPQTYWERGFDYNQKFNICVPGSTKMVGRPAIYITEMLKKARMDTSFDHMGNEDAALAIRLENLGAKFEIGRGVSYRTVPKYFKEHLSAWKKYGRGDHQLLVKYPDKTFSILRHLLWVYPIKRSWGLIKNGKGVFVGFTVCSGLFRFAFLIASSIQKKIS